MDATIRGQFVYIVSVNSVYENETYSRIEVFGNYDDAKKLFDKFVDEDDNNIDAEGWVIEQDKDCYLSYQEGYYNDYHFEVNLFAKEIL